MPVCVTTMGIGDSGLLGLVLKQSIIVLSPVAKPDILCVSKACLNYSDVFYYWE